MDLKVGESNKITDNFIFLVLICLATIHWSFLGALLVSYVPQLDESRIFPEMKLRKHRYLRENIINCYPKRPVMKCFVYNAGDSRV